MLKIFLIKTLCQGIAYLSEQWSEECSEGGQGAEQVAGEAALVRVAEELGVEILVALQREVPALRDLVKCLVQHLTGQSCQQNCKQCLTMFGSPHRWLFAMCSDNLWPSIP